MSSQRNGVFGILVLLAILLSTTASARQLATATMTADTVDIQAGTWDCFDPGMADPCRNTLEAVAMLSGSDGWAVGENGTIVRWNGNSWAKISGPTAEPLYGVSALSSNAAWAVGDNGTILYWNGGTWTNANYPTTRWLSSVTMISAGEGWAVGDSGLVLRWNGTDWTSVNSSTYSALFAVAMLSSDKGWAVGSGGTIIQWNDSTWVTDSSPTTQILYAVDAVSNNDAWAVGDGGIILHWDGYSWTSVPSPTTATLYGVSMRSPGEGWVVGDGIILHWNGSNWAIADHPGGTFYAVSTLATGDSWAVGPTGVIMQWNSSEWTTVSSPTTNRWFEAMAMVSINEGWAVGNDILHWDGNAWTTFYDAPSAWFYGISISPGDRWIVGSEGTIARWNGSEWSSFSSPTGACLYDVDIVSADDGWSVGANGTIIHWDGSAWEIFNSPINQHLFGLSMVSANNGWTVGDGGVILHWNGSAWTEFSSPTTNTLRSVDMVSTSDGWAVGDDGTLLHWNGSAWNSHTGPAQPGTPLNTVVMVSGDDGWVAGPADHFLHWDGNAWTIVDFPEISTYVISWGWSAIAMTPGTGGTNGWAVSRNGLILQYRAQGSTMYSISGHVTDENGNPISQTNVSAGTAGSATTDDAGYYIVSDLSAGAYTLTPTKSGYIFSPTSRTVSVPPDATGVDFTGLRDPDLALAEQFAPYLYRSDIYWPILIEPPVEAADLYYWDGLLHRKLPNPHPDQLDDDPYNGSNSYLDFPGEGWPGMAEKFKEFMNQPGWQPQVYARVEHVGDEIVIQYWFFYYDNPGIAIDPGFNHHEGDWEMIQVILDSSETPQYAVYSQHEGGTRRLWEHLDTDASGEHPKVYVAWGSHASYFKPYPYRVLGIFEDKPSDDNRVYYSLELLSENEPWLDFEGHWGKWTVDWPGNDGPTGPKQKEDKWDNYLNWGESQEWDERAEHNANKYICDVTYPGDVDVYDRWTGEHTGRRTDGIIEEQIPDSEYIDNPYANKGWRTILLHDPKWPHRLHYRCEKSGSGGGGPWISSGVTAVTTTPLTITLNAPDNQSNLVTSVEFVSVTMSISATGVISAYSESEYHLLVDDDGDGIVNRDITPTLVLTTVVDFTPPSPITDLAVLSTTAGTAVLTWTAPGDDGDAGAAAAYDIRYYTAFITDTNWISATQVISPQTPSLAGSTEVFTVTGMAGGVHYFAIQSIDDAFQHSALSNVVQAEIPYHLYLPLILRNRWH